MVKRILDPRQSDAGPSFSLSSISYINQLVVGENDTTYAAGAYDDYYRARIVAFDINGGGKMWDYDPPYGNPGEAWTDLVAALPGGGVAATVGHWQESRIPFTLDANGNRTDAAAPLGDTYVTYSGVGEDTWYAAPCTIATACFAPASMIVPAVVTETSTNINPQTSAAYALVGLFLQAANVPNKLEYNREYSDKRTDILLAARDIPPQPSLTEGMQFEMEYHILPQADTILQLQKNSRKLDDDRVTQAKYSKIEIKLWESQRGGEWGWQGGLLGEGHDVLNLAAGRVDQRWYATDASGNKRIQLVIGLDDKGNLIKAWTVHVEITTSGPRYLKLD
jgi:hypothetical protein